MSPEFYAIIGVGASLGALIVGLAGLMIYLFSHLNRRIDRLEEWVDRLEDTVTQRMNRLEDKFDRLVERFEQLREQVSDLANRVAKLEWMFERQFENRPQPPYNDED